MGSLSACKQESVKYRGVVIHQNLSWKQQEEGKTKELGWAGCDQKSKQQLRTSP